MADPTATLTKISTESMGNHRLVLGTLTLVASTSSYSAGGIPLKVGNSTLTTTDALRRVLGLNVEIKQIHVQNPLEDANATQRSGYLAKINPATAKLILIAGSGTTETSLDEPAGTALTDGTYVSTFFAIGK